MKSITNQTTGDTVTNFGYSPNCEDCGAITPHSPCKDNVQRCDHCYTEAKRAGVLDHRGYPTNHNDESTL